MYCIPFLYDKHEQKSLICLLVYFSGRKTLPVAHARGNTTAEDGILDLKSLSVNVTADH